MSSLTAAPTAVDLSDLPARPATSRVLVLVAYSCVLVLLAIRVPRTYAYLSAHVPETLSVQIHDEGLESLALKTGVFLAFLVTALAVAVFFGLARVLEKRLFAGALPLPAGRSLGLYCLVVMLAVLPLQVQGALSGSRALHHGLFTYLYVGTVGLLAPLLFRSTWSGGDRGRTAMVFLTSAGLAALTVVG